MPRVEDTMMVEKRYQAWIDDALSHKKDIKTICLEEHTTYQDIYNMSFISSINRTLIESPIRFAIEGVTINITKIDITSIVRDMLIWGHSIVRVSVDGDVERISKSYYYLYPDVYEKLNISPYTEDSEGKIIQLVYIYPIEDNYWRRVDYTKSGDGMWVQRYIDQKNPTDEWKPTFMEDEVEGLISETYDYWPFVLFDIDNDTSIYAHVIESIIAYENIYREIRFDNLRHSSRKLFIEGTDVETIVENMNNDVNILPPDSKAYYADSSNDLQSSFLEQEKLRQIITDATGVVSLDTVKGLESGFARKMILSPLISLGNKLRDIVETSLSYIWDILKQLQLTNGELEVIWTDMLPLDVNEQRVEFEQKKYKLDYLLSLFTQGLITDLEYKQLALPLLFGEGENDG